MHTCPSGAWEPYAPTTLNAQQQRSEPVRFTVLEYSLTILLLFLYPQDNTERMVVTLMVGLHIGMIWIVMHVRGTPASAQISSPSETVHWQNDTR